MTGQELFDKYMSLSTEQLPQFLQSLTWEDVQAIGNEITTRAKAARDAGNTDAVLDIVSKPIPFLEYFDKK